MDRQDAQSGPWRDTADAVRALTLAVEALAIKVAEQNTQRASERGGLTPVAQIVAARPDTQIAALRTELGDMGRWCERFNMAHERTLARCNSLEIKLSAANQEVARLREAARIAALPAEPEAKEVGACFCGG